MTISEPGVYDIPAEEYHADPCPEPSLSNSIAKLLVAQTPRHAWAAHPRLNPAFEATNAERFDLGSTAHALMLGDQAKFQIVDADDWRTKAAKEAREEARFNGRIPVLRHQWEETEMMVRTGRRQLEAHQEAANSFTAGKQEQTLVWREGDVWCRSRLDWLPDDRVIFDDYKTTAASAGPDEWPRTAYSCGFDMQAAFYRRGIKALGLSQDPQFRFIVQENYAPFALCVIGLSPAAIDLAEHKVTRAIDIWRTCLKSNVWPGYPDRTCYIDPPVWAEAQFLARDERADDTLRQATNFQRSFEAQRP